MLKTLILLVWSVSVVFAVVDFTVTVWTETEELALGQTSDFLCWSISEREWPHMVLPGSCHLHAKNRMLYSRWTRHHPFFKMQPYLSLSQISFPPNILYYKNSEANRLSWGWKRKEEKKKKTSGLCDRSGGAACQVRFAKSHIPKPVIINGLTSTGKKKKAKSLKTPDKRNPCRQSKNKLKDPL